MATVNKSSLRTEFDALKARFESLCAAGKMSAESRALVDALLMLFELLMAVFMGSVRNSVFGPPWPDPVGPTALGHCSSLARVCRPQSTGTGRSSPPQWGTERFPRAVHGRGPLGRQSAGGQAVEIAGHDASTTNRSPKRIASSGRTWCQNSGGARHFRCTPRSAK